MKETDSDVLIIGSGLVGLVAAHSLSFLNYKVIIVDKKKPPNTNNLIHDTRTVAVSEGSKKYLERLLLWKYLKKYSQPIKKIKVYDRALSNKIFFKNSEKNEKLGYVIENSIFTKILREKLIAKKNIKIFNGEGVTQIKAKDKISTAYFEKIKINSKLIIAADGKNSAVRKIMGKMIYQKHYPENALVINLFHEKNLQETAYEIFLKTGPLAILPMKKIKNYYQSSIIWSNSEATHKKLIKCNDKFLSNLLEEEVGSFLGKIINVNSKQIFPLSAHLNESFVNKRLVYIGDSAHSIHPIAGQGWNLGIKDIKNLELIFKEIKPKGGEIGDSFFCKKYNNISYKNAFQLYQITDKLNSHFKVRNSLYRMFSKGGFKVIEESSNLKKIITNFAMGIN